jgi:sigma-B regulation protein RsbU (phosphoserine phosphatase)
MDRTRQYFTLVYGVIDPSTGRFEYVTAGHPSPIKLPSGGVPFAVEGAGLPVGMLDDAAYDDVALTLEPGDRLYFYTDGVIEALDADDVEFGHARLLEAIAARRNLPLRAGLEEVAADVRSWCGGRLKDDVSLLAVERAR